MSDQFIAGLRALADLLQEHPEIPVPTQYMPLLVRLAPDTAAPAALAVVDLLAEHLTDAVPTAGAGPSGFSLDGWMHGLRVEIRANRDAVCESVEIPPESRPAARAYTYRGAPAPEAKPVKL